MGIKKIKIISFFSLITTPFSIYALASCSSKPTSVLEDSDFLNIRFPENIRNQTDLTISSVSYSNLENFLSKNKSEVLNDRTVVKNIKDPASLNNFWNIIRSMDYSNPSNIMPNLPFSNTYAEDSFIYISEIILENKKSISFNVHYKNKTSKESTVSIYLEFEVQKAKEFFDKSFPKESLSPRIKSNDISFNSLINDLNKFYNPERANNDTVYIFSTPTFVRYLELFLDKSPVQANSSIFNVTNLINDNIVIDKDSVNVVTRIGETEQDFRNSDSTYKNATFDDTNEKTFYLKFKVLFLKEDSFINLNNLNIISNEGQDNFYSKDVKIEINVSLTNTTINNSIDKYISGMRDTASFSSTSENKTAIIDFIKSDDFNKSIPLNFFTNYIPPDPRNQLPLQKLEGYIELLVPSISLYDKTSNSYINLKPEDIDEEKLAEDNIFQITYTLQNKRTKYKSSKTIIVEMVESNAEVQYNNIYYSLNKVFSSEDNSNNSVMTSFYTYKVLRKLYEDSKLQGNNFSSIDSQSKKDLLSYFLSYNIKSIDDSNFKINNVDYMNKEGVSMGFLNSSVNDISPVAFRITDLDDNIKIKMNVPEIIDTSKSKDFLESNKVSINFSLSYKDKKSFDIKIPTYISNYDDNPNFFSSYNLYNSILRPILSSNTDKSNSVVNNVKINQSRWIKFVNAYNDLYDNYSSDKSSGGLLTNEVLLNLNTLFSVSHITPNNSSYGGILLNRPASRLSSRPTSSNNYNFNMTFITRDNRSQMNFTCSVEVTL
jgi:hypothetical protein